MRMEVRFADEVKAEKNKIAKTKNKKKTEKQKMASILLGYQLIYSSWLICEYKIN